jgi:ATP-binding cassette subfamily F protein 3
MLLQPSNFLIMDEPTNHLDMRSKKVLQEALQNFEGSFIIVSHDRSFLDPIVNKVLEFSEGSIKTYLGSISDYLFKKKMERETVAQQSRPVPLNTSNNSVSNPQSHLSPLKQTKQREAGRRKELNKKVQPLRKGIEALENEVQSLETQKAHLETTLADPELYKRGDEAKFATQEYKEVQRLLEEKYAKWTVLTEEVARIEERG